MRDVICWSGASRGVRHEQVFFGKPVFFSVVLVCCASVFELNSLSMYQIPEQQWADWFSSYGMECHTELMVLVSVLGFWKTKKGVGERMQMMPVVNFIVAGTSVTTNSLVPFLANGPLWRDWGACEYHVHDIVE